MTLSANHQLLLSHSMSPRGFGMMSVVSDLSRRTLLRLGAAFQAATRWHLSRPREYAE